MPAIVESPAAAEEAVKRLGGVPANRPERRHLAEYLTGLLVAEGKNVSAINRQFARTTDRSCLNRWLTRADRDAQALNRRRPAWLQEDPSTRYGARGVIALDNVLIGHDGQLIEDVGWFHPRGQPQPRPRPGAGLRRRPEVQPPDGLPGPDAQGPGGRRADRAPGPPARTTTRP